MQFSHGLSFRFSMNGLGPGSEGGCGPQNSLGNHSIIPYTISETVASMSSLREERTLSSTCGNVFTLRSIICIFMAVFNGLCNHYTMSLTFGLNEVIRSFVIPKCQSRQLRFKLSTLIGSYVCIHSKTRNPGRNKYPCNHFCSDISYGNDLGPKHEPAYHSKA